MNLHSKIKKKKTHCHIKNLYFLNLWCIDTELMTNDECITHTLANKNIQFFLLVVVFCFSKNKFPDNTARESRVLKKELS